MSDLSLSLDLLRSALLQIQAAGDTGFEGLVATLLASKTKLQLRLAKSGSQFGRDASSPRDVFAVAMEAKRYDSNLRLEDLLGKATSAGLALAADTDLWIVCATTEIGDDIVKKVSIVVEQNGMSVLFLDWSPAPLPPLAVLLASSSETAVTWFSEHSTSTDLGMLQSTLQAVRSSDLFDDAEATLLRSLSASSVGLDTLLRKNRSWLEERWSDALLSRQDLGQVVTPLAGDRAVLQGRAARLGLEAKVRTNSEPKVVAVLGEEGVGKTWLISDWWLNSSNSPLLVPILGRAVESIDHRDTFVSLAKIFQQQYRDTQIDLLGWERRLRRWAKRTTPSTPWCVVVLDGLNERPDLPWADTIISFARTLAQAGALLIVTCRPAFWERDIHDRLRRELLVDELRVPEYTESEVDQLLLKAGVDPASLSDQLRRFLSNPRVCSVALSILSELNTSAAQLTVERLQLEYWKHRLTERGNLLAHNSDDFHKVLKAHAKEWLTHPAQQFDLDAVPTKLTLAQRKPAAIKTDLLEIVEGRFMTASSVDQNSYEFRPEAVPFAIGLLLAHELRILRNPTEKLYEETIDALIEPISAFDLTSLIIGAAFSLACLDNTYPVRGSRALLKVWASLQNLDQEAVSRISPNVLLRCDLFCEVLELLHESPDYHAHTNEISRIVFGQARNAHVRSVLNVQIPRWLGRWCRKAIPFPREKTPNLDRQSVQDSLALLLPDERKEFDDLCLEVTEPQATDTDELAVFQMVGIPQEELVRGVWAWCLAQSIAGDHTNAQEDLAWAIRLNPHDWAGTARAARSTASAASNASSEPYRKAASRLLRLFGDLQSEAQAEELTGPIEKGESWHRVTAFCDTNPHDPNAPVCTNLSRSIETVESVPLESLRISRSPTIEDHDWAAAIPALARFAPDSFVKAARRLVSTIEAREGMALIALSWDLPEFSPLLDEVAVSSIERALDRFVLATPDWKDLENQLIVNEALEAILPHVNADRQVQILLALPDAVTMFLSLEGTFKQLDADRFESALEHAAQSSTDAALERILFHASAHPMTLSDVSRDVIRSLMARTSSTVRNVAFNVARIAGDLILDKQILDDYGVLPKSDEDFYREEALAQAVARSGNSSMLHVVSADRRQAVAAQMDDDAIALIVDELEADIGRLLKPILAFQEQRVIVDVKATPDGLMQRIEVSLPEPDDPVQKLRDLSGSPEEHNERGRQARRERKELCRQLEKEGAAAVLAIPFPGCIRRVVAMAPERVRGWLERIAAEQNGAILRQVFNLGASLAAEFVTVDGALAASVLRHLRDIPASPTISLGEEQVPLYFAAVFTSSSSPEMKALQERFVMNAMSDAELEVCARAASVRGKDWLLGFIRHNYLADNPNRQARALTLAGFCFPDEDLDYVFLQERRTGFLGSVHEFASKQRKRAAWAAHWCRAALAADTAVDFWRFGKLAEGVVDPRFVRAFDGLVKDSTNAAFVSELLVRLHKAAEKRARLRSDTLLGMKVPSDSLAWAVRNSQS